MLKGPRYPRSPVSTVALVPENNEIFDTLLTTAIGGITNADAIENDPLHLTNDHHDPEIVDDVINSIAFPLPAPSGHSYQSQISSGSTDSDDSLLPAYKRKRSEVNNNNVNGSSSDHHQLMFENLGGDLDEDDPSVWEVVEPSDHSMNTVNPIRRIVDAMNVQPNPDLELIRLNLGDPSVSGVLPAHPSTLQAVVGSLMSGKYNGYGPATGFQEIRDALANHVTDPLEAPVTADDIILTSGCSHALQIAIESLGDRGQNILVPRPGFSIYGTLARPMGIELRYYDLLADRGWEADLTMMASLIDENTAAILVNNPSNPCGAVYSREHLEDIKRLAFVCRVPIIADEIYGNMIYGGAKFYPMATLSPKVPVLTCDGISKRYLVPGWRLGWLIIHDVEDAFAKVRQAARSLAQKIVGPCALIQGALPAILRNTPQEFFDRTRAVLGANALATYNGLSAVPGLRPIRSHGAMYIMINVDVASFPAFQSEVEFIQALLAEQSVFCLPGSAFNYGGAFRIALATRKEAIVEACKRIRAFCKRHYVAPPPAESELC